MELMEKMRFMRKLTRRERNLLILLMVIIIIWLAFRFVITPQHDRLQDLIGEKSKYDERISYMNSILIQEGSIEKEWDSLHREKDRIISKYFSNLDQSEIIYLLNELLGDENIEVLDIIFSRPSEEKVGDLLVDAMEITIPYRAKYERIVETIRSLTTSPKRILVTGLTMDNQEGDMIAGNIYLKAYGLKGAGHEEDKLFISQLSDKEVSNPFKPFDNYVESRDDIEIEGDNFYEEGTNHIAQHLPEYNRSDENQLAEGVDEYKRELLEDFGSAYFNFIPSSSMVEGNVSRSYIGKSGRNSIRVEYNILALGEENRAYIDLSHRNILLKYPPSTIGLWVRSYAYSPITLGIRLKGQAGELIDMELIKGINWTGWQYVEAPPPSDLSLYPLYIDKIYLEVAYNREDYGVLLLDKLEANYPKGNQSKEDFTFYIVEKGDSLDKISLKFYGTTKKKDIIMKHNEINDDKDIREGKILVIPR